MGWSLAVTKTIAINNVLKCFQTLTYPPSKQSNPIKALIPRAYPKYYTHFFILASQ